MIRPAPPPAQTLQLLARALELKTLRVVFVRQNPAYRPAAAPAPNPLSRPTCFASWPLSRVGNPRGLRDALDATRRDALAATRTDRATAHGRSQLVLLASWLFGGLFSQLSDSLCSRFSHKLWHCAELCCLFCVTGRKNAHFE